jgi:GTPase Era involved in 16S rRNA processing
MEGNTIEVYPHHGLNHAQVLDSLKKLGEFLENPATLLLPDEARETLSNRYLKLLDKFQKPQAVLYAAIVGGTGTGKSTLINALAGRHVSSPSDKRPFTEKVVAYRHIDTPRGMEEFSGLFRSPDATHNIDDIRRMVLLDLPDFDGKETANREVVLNLAPQVDVIIWVVSPEKYSDASFYRLVKDARIFHRNFVFVFNKADEILSSDEPNCSARLNNVLADFRSRLNRETGIPDPAVFCISAEQSFENRVVSPFLGESFQRLRGLLFSRRDEKDIAAVRTANLNEEVIRLCMDIGPFIRQYKINGLNSLLSVLDGANLPRLSKIPLESGYTSRLAKDIFQQLILVDDSVEPVKYGMRLFGSWKNPDVKESWKRITATLKDLTDSITKAGLTQIDTITAKIDSQLVGFSKKSTDSLGLMSPDESLEKAFSQTLSQLENSPALFEGRSKSWFLPRPRFYQKIALFAPVIFFTLKLIGEENLVNFLVYPGFTSLIRLFMGFMFSLFGQDGFYGIMSLALIEILLTILLAWRSLDRVRRVSNNISSQILENFKERVDSSWAEAIRGRREVVGNFQKGLIGYKELEAELGLNNIKTATP